MPPSPPINPRPIATLITRGVVVDFFLDLRKQRRPTTSEAEEYYCRDAATKATEYKDTPVRTLLRKISSTMTNVRARAVFPIVFLSLVIPTALGWIPTLKSGRTASALHASTIPGSIHGQNACFLPLKQLDQDYYAPRIVQIAGAYPGLTREEFFAVKSEPSAELGQWTYDFSDPDGPQLGTVAIEGSNVVSAAEDPVAIIAEHTALNVPLPKEIKEAVDLVVLVDRAQNRFAERKFLVVDVPGIGLTIAAYPERADLPANCEILGQVVFVQVPWLPSMKPTKSGFMEVDEYF